GLLIWVAVFAASRIVSLASLVAALGVPLFQWWRAGWRPALLPVALTVIGALIVLRHRANLRRLWAGTEPRFSRVMRAKRDRACGGH
ncbi:MAG: glycerol-3-phosphate acyltransferase, partial [bacterium]